MRIGVNSGSIRERHGLSVKESDEDLVELCVQRGAAPRRDPRGARLLRHRDLDQGAHRRAHGGGEPRARHGGATTRSTSASRTRAASCPATVKTSAAYALLLTDGIGDTLRVSITGDNRDEVKVAHQLLQALDLRQPTFDVYACPSCGRAEVDLVGITKAVEEATKDLTAPCRVAVMGCIVNGPGEAAEADVSISAGRGFGFIYRGPDDDQEGPGGRPGPGAPRRDRRLDRRAGLKAHPGVPPSPVRPSARRLEPPPGSPRSS